MPWILDKLARCFSRFLSVKPQKLLRFYDRLIAKPYGLSHEDGTRPLRQAPGAAEMGAQIMRKLLSTAVVVLALLTGIGIVAASLEAPMDAETAALITG
jgi:hypothetical protein